MSNAESELQRAKVHLAQVIDEVVFAEGETSKAQEQLRKAEASIAMMSDVLENILGYAAKLEQSIVLPALGDLDVALAARVDLASARATAVVAAERLAAAQSQIACNPRLARIVGNMKDSHHALSAVAAAQREAMLTAPSAGMSINLEEAFVLCDSLLSSKQQLSVLLADSVSRLLQSRAALDMGSPNPVPERGAYTAKMEELEKSRTLVAQVTRERDVLLQRVREQLPLESLQQQHLAEKQALQQRIAALEDLQQQTMSDRANVAQRLDTLHRALEQSGVEKQLLSQELNTLRRVTGSAPPLRSSSTAATQQQIGSTSGAADREMAHALRLEMDALIRDHSSVVTQLEGRISQLRSELHNAKAAAAQQGASAALLGQLQRNNDSLRQELNQLQQQVASTGGRGSAANDSLASANRVAQFEKTIQSLHEELAAVDRRVNAAEQQHSTEKARMMSMFDEERRRYQEEREECDALVLKMTNELEFLIRENTALKHRFRLTAGPMSPAATAAS